MPISGIVSATFSEEVQYYCLYRRELKLVNQFFTKLRGKTGGGQKIS